MNTIKKLNNIQKIRWEMAVSLRELASLSDVSYTTINMIENGRCYPTQLVMMKIAKALKCNVCDVFILDYDGIDL